MSTQPLKVIQNNEKQMPCNIEAEQALIGSILVSNDIYDEITPIIDYQKFFDPVHVKIFQTIEKLISTGKKGKETLVTIMDKPGTYYFACTIMGHSMMGHKITIEVVDNVVEQFTSSNIDIDFLRANGDSRILKILEKGTHDLTNRFYKYCVNMRNDKSSSIGKIEVYDKSGNNPKFFYVSSCCSGCYCRVIQKEYYYSTNSNKQLYIIYINKKTIWHL